MKVDNQTIKRLKIACENIKKILSESEGTIIHVNNFYKDKEDLIIRNKYFK